MTLLGHPERF
jgi:hypothetical protein